MKKCIWLVMLFVLTLALATGCGSNSQEPDTQTTQPEGNAQNETTQGLPDRITITTATSGGSFYAQGIALAQVWAENLKINCSSQGSNGSAENVDILARGEAQVAFMQNDVAMYAYNGQKDFATRKLEDLRVMAPLGLTHYHILVDSGSGINKIEDLRGKRVGIGRPNSGQASSSLAILGSFGIDPEKDIKAEWIGSQECADALRDRKIDAAIIVGAAPVGSVTDLLISTKHVKLLEITPEEADQINKAEPWIFPQITPANTYPNQDKDMGLVCHLPFLVTRASLLDEDTVYTLLKTMYDNVDKLGQAHAGFKDPAFQDFSLLEKIPAPLHDGAKKYFTEKGLLK
jgi:TRAP transporter TAXI family solute receptor